MIKLEDRYDEDVEVTERQRNKVSTKREHLTFDLDGLLRSNKNRIHLLIEKNNDRLSYRALDEQEC